MSRDRIIVLDRDGVINEDSDAYIKSPEEWIPIAGSIEAIAMLSKAGYDIFVATNQSGIARGYYDLDTLQSIHEKMLSLVKQAGGKIKAIVFCPHGPDDGCRCRKPAPGLLEQIEAEYHVSLDGKVIVGDSLRDLECGLALGCEPVLVKTGKGLKSLETVRQSRPELADVPVYNDLLEFTREMLAKSNG